MASKKESTFINMVVVLLIVSGIAATTLAFVYQATKGPIEIAKLKKQKKAITQVVAEFNNNPIGEMFKVAIAEGDTLECYPAKKDDKLVGIAIKTYTKKGFSGEIWIMVGYNLDGSINNTSVLEHKETPGLGDKMQKSKSDFSLQFNKLIPLFEGNNPKNIKVEKDGGEIVAITASTISSRAFCDAINRSFIAFELAKNKTSN